MSPLLSVGGFSVGRGRYARSGAAANSDPPGLQNDERAGEFTIMNRHQARDKLGNQSLRRHLSRKARNDDAVVRPGRVLEDVRVADIAGEEDCPAFLGQLEDCCVRRSTKSEVSDVGAFVALLLQEKAQRSRQVFIDKEAGHY